MCTISITMHVTQLTTSSYGIPVLWDFCTTGCHAVLMVFTFTFLQKRLPSSNMPLKTIYDLYDLFSQSINWTLLDQKLSKHSTGFYYVRYRKRLYKCRSFSAVILSSSALSLIYPSTHNYSWWLQSIRTTDLITVSSMTSLKSDLWGHRSRGLYIRVEIHLQWEVRMPINTSKRHSDLSSRRSVVCNYRPHWHVFAKCHH